MVEASLPRRIVYREQALSALELFLESLGARRVIVVTDGKLLSIDKVKSLIEGLKGKLKAMDVFSSVPPEPPVDSARELATMIKGFKPDVVVAIGGGSVIDVAKAGLAMALNPGLEFGAISPFTNLGLETSRIKLIAVPSTAGTGSDASYGIVLKDSNGGKIAVGSPEVVPYATILDPTLPAGAPRNLKTAAAADALSHAMEALVGQQATPLSDALAEKAAVIIFTRLADALDGDLDAMAELHLAATMAGMAFTNAGLGLAHAIAHPLGGKLGLHHGTVVGIVLPYVVGFYEARSPETKSKYTVLKAILEDVYGLGRSESMNAHIFRLYQDVGFPARFRGLGIDRETYTSAAEYAALYYMNDPDIVFSPVVPDPDEVKSLLEQMY